MIIGDYKILSKNGKITHCSASKINLSEAHKYKEIAILLLRKVRELQAINKHLIGKK